MKISGYTLAMIGIIVTALILEVAVVAMMIGVLSPLEPSNSPVAASSSAGLGSAAPLAGK